MKRNCIFSMCFFFNSLLVTQLKTFHFTTMLPIFVIDYKNIIFYCTTSHTHKHTHIYKLLDVLDCENVEYNENPLDQLREHRSEKNER